MFYSYPNLYIYIFFFKLFISYVCVTQRFELLQRKTLYKYLKHIILYACGKENTFIDLLGNSELLEYFEIEIQFLYWPKKDKMTSVNTNCLLFCNYKYLYSAVSLNALCNTHIHTLMFVENMMIEQQITLILLCERWVYIYVLISVFAYYTYVTLINKDYYTVFKKLK